MIYAASEKIKAAHLNGENPLPHFRDKRHHKDVRFYDGTPPFCFAGAGYETATRILPYAVQDRYTRRRVESDVRTIVIENEFIKATFLPDWGGRLWSLYQKTEKRELLYKNDVLQPANLAIRNAWFSGGIEWNIGQYGHAFTTCSPVSFAKMVADSGEEFLRMFSYERCKDFFWQIDFYLPPASAVLYAHPVIFNIHDSAIPLYYWTNIAVPQTAFTRVFAASEYALFTDPNVCEGDALLGYAQLPELPIAPGVDFSYPSRAPFSSEYFFNCTNTAHPWEAALEQDGSGLFDVSTAPLAFRKMFCWGNCSGGRHWGSFLAGKCETHFPAERDDAQDAQCCYLEIQAGIAQTQLHGLDMPPHSRWEWTQAFGLLHAKSDDVVQSDWRRARQAVEVRVRETLDCALLEKIDKLCARNADAQTSELLCNADEWGALERQRRKLCGECDVPKSFFFASAQPRDNATASLKNPWHELLCSGTFPDRAPEELPLPFMTGNKWKQLLIDSIARCNAGQVTWFALYHLGVMELEEGNDEAARAAWEKAESICSTAWTLRNLAQLALREGAVEQALELYRCAHGAPGFKTDSAIAEEYAALLVEQKRFEEVRTLYHALPDAWCKIDSLLIAYGKACAACGDSESALHVLSHDFANIREKDSPLAEIWHCMRSDAVPFCLEFSMNSFGLPPA